MKKLPNLFPIGTQIRSTEVKLVDGQITRFPTTAVVEGVHDFNKSFPRRKFIPVYHTRLESGREVMETQKSVSENLI